MGPTGVADPTRGCLLRMLNDVVSRGRSRKAKMPARSKVQGFLPPAPYLPGLVLGWGIDNTLPTPGAKARISQGGLPITHYRARQPSGATTTFACGIGI